MDLDLEELLLLALRWTHVFAAILWIGQTFLFTWFERRFAEAAARGEDEAAARVWMVHSGGFYVVQKQRAPVRMPGTLHWFKWEAATTWLTGVALLALIYWKGRLLVPMSEEALPHGTAVTLSGGLLLAGFALYEAIWRSRLAESEKLATLVSCGWIVALVFACRHLFAERAAYMEVGAVFGTVMAANVWVGILPAQRAMVRAMESGVPFDPAPGIRARRRTKHNNYLVVPLVFIMLSSHFPTVSYGHPRAAWILLALILAGFGAAWAVRRR